MDYEAIMVIISKDNRIPILTGWLLEVCAEYKDLIYIETYIGTIKVLYAYYTKCENILTKDLQLIGLICLDLAYKIIQCDDDYEFSIDEWIYLANNSFDRDYFKKLQWIVLETFDFNIYPLIQELFPENFFDLSLGEKSVDLLGILKIYCKIDSFDQYQKNYLKQQLQQLHEEK